MQDLTGDRSPFRAHDKYLLQTGVFSDCQLKAGNRFWNVHKSIVFLRSTYIENGFDEEVKVIDVGFCTEKQVELFLEYVYSGEIENIADFSLADCVEISAAANRFMVDEMEAYAKKTLWGKLTRILRAVSTILLLPIGDDRHRQDAIDAKLNEFSFHAQFTDAVGKAYDEMNRDIKIALADFVWLGRDWLIRHPIIEELNISYPKFGNRVLTTLNKGPQSPFVRLDEQLMSAADKKPGRLRAH